MLLNNPGTIEIVRQAKRYAFLLLKFRQRSEQEIRQRLKKKQFPETVIQETVSFLKDKKFIDDGVFAREWIGSRIKKPMGFRRLREELKRKGIDKEIIDSQLEEIKKGYDEKGIVAEVISNKLHSFKGQDAQKAKRRLYAYLLRRGFSPDIIIEAVNRAGF
ncbi:MAG: regulatory protein RecX [Candidatus Omnitrophota bacterium]|jgi:regulatory protein